jgi:signal transduction histidine kinase
MSKILVIEDEQVVRKNILELLDAEGFEVVEADNGQVGVQLAQQCIPDLIICDVMMPELDGYGVLQTLRQLPETATIPLILLTAKSEREDFRRGMTLGADDYLTKPFTRTELLEAIAARLTKNTPVVHLKQQIVDLQQSNLSKEEFINTAAHELRGPLSNIKVAVEMLQNTIDLHDQQFYLQILQSACDREAELINDLLDLYRLDGPITSRHLEVLNLQNWIPAIAEPFQLRAINRQQTLTVSVAADVAPLLSDYTALQRMLSELLNNACKYTPPGGTIKLTVSSVQLQSDQIKAPIEEQIEPQLPSEETLSHLDRKPEEWCQIQVGNHAEVPDQALPYLFEQFYRVPGADQWNQGGTGLGLTLVKKVVEALQGTIQASSMNGWTQFTVRLPFKPYLL